MIRNFKKGEIICRKSCPMIKICTTKIDNLLFFTSKFGQAEIEDLNGLKRKSTFNF